MSDELIGVLIGGTFGFIGALLGTLISIWAENRNAKRANLHAVRLRLVGEFVQTSEIMRFIESQRQRPWPHFWKKGLADLSRAHLEEVDFRKKDLRHVIFYRAHLRGANFFQANLEGCDFTNADLSEVDLFQANVSKATFFKTNLRGSKLDRANLAEASLVACDLDGASLLDASLVGADMRFANLKKANLTGADVRGANWAGANLSEARLEGADLTRLIYNSGTAWPDGLDPTRAGAELVEQAGSKHAMTAIGRRITNVSTTD